MRPARVAVLAAAVALACAGGTTTREPARVAVELLRGFTPEQLGDAETSAPIVVILDATLSMSLPASRAASRYAAAQRAAARFIRSAPAERPLWLYAMGAKAGSACRPVARASRALLTGERGRLVTEVNALAPGSETGLAAALDGVRGDLTKAGPMAGSRVVVFSDLGPQCGGDVCQAAAQLVRAGVRVDLVAIGESPGPACLREPGGLTDVEPPPPAAGRPVFFRLEVDEPEPMTVGWSEAGGLPIAIPGGRATVVVDLDPPLRVDAYFASGRRHVLQIVDFPMLDPPARQWRWLDTTAPVPAEPEP